MNDGLDKYVPLFVFFRNYLSPEEGILGVQLAEHAIPLAITVFIGTSTGTTFPFPKPKYS